MNIRCEVTKLHAEIMAMPVSHANSTIPHDLQETFNKLLSSAKGQFPDISVVRAMESVTQSMPLLELATRLTVLKTHLPDRIV